MTSHAFVSCVVGVALALGCRSPEKDNDSPSAATSGAPSGAEMQDVVEGHYVFDLESNVFSPCGSDKIYWVRSDAAKLASLRVAYNQWFGATRPEPYSPMFARFRGEVIDGERDGFEENYDGLFLVKEIVLLRGVKEGDCRPLPRKQQE